jgi:hypothetical protein
MEAQQCLKLKDVYHREVNSMKIDRCLSFCFINILMTRNVRNCMSRKTSC